MRKVRLSQQEMEQLIQSCDQEDLIMLYEEFLAEDTLELKWALYTEKILRNKYGVEITPKVN